MHRHRELVRRLYCVSMLNQQFIDFTTHFYPLLAGDESKLLTEYELQTGGYFLGLGIFIRAASVI